MNFRGEVAQLAGQSGQASEIPVQEQEANQPPSIHIHNCHSALREVEVLHDQLLDLFHRDKNLKPRDVVVMMPRVAPYAPYIDVVFKSAARHQQIRYHTSDRTLLEESPLLNSFETLLKLPDSRLPLSEVLGLLEVPAIQRRFGLDRDGYEQLKAAAVSCLCQSHFHLSPSEGCFPCSSSPSMRGQKDGTVAPAVHRKPD